MKSFLLVIDIQQGFIDENTVAVKARIDELLKCKIFDCIIASVYHNYEGSPISRLMDWHEMTTPDEQKIVGEAVNADHFIYKTEYSAFNNSLMEILKNENGGELPESVFLVGVDTECCVLMTAADLFEEGIRPVVLTYYCGSSGGEISHNGGIISLQSIIGKNNLHDGKVTDKTIDKILSDESLQ